MQKDIEITMKPDKFPGIAPHDLLPVCVFRNIYF